MKVLFLFGPNLAALGSRDPARYGEQMLPEIMDEVRERGSSLGHEVQWRHSDHEGDLVGWMLSAAGEGFEAVAVVFEKIAVAEKQHEKRYRDLLKNLNDGRVFKKDGKVMWRCRNCGYLHEGEEAPAMCPACAHPQAHFEVLGENW